MNNTIEFDGYKMSLINLDDIEAYYKYAFLESDDEAKYYTATPDGYTKDQINDYLKKITESSQRYDFLIKKDKEIIGEVVLSEIENKNCHYRICIYKKENFSKGIGYRATKEVLNFAFNELSLNSVELEVFPFNERGISLYKKLGFHIEGEIIDEEAESLYQKIITMTLLKENYSH